MNRKAVAWTFGRFSPPTLGHQKLIDRVKDEAHKIKGEARIYLSSSYDNRKNPLTYRDKVQFMRQMFRGVNVIDDKTKTNPFVVIISMYEEGVTDFVMVAGSDRVPEYKKNIRAFLDNPRHPESFNSWDVISAGERDPDEQGATGISGTKMRRFAATGDYDSFSRGAPSSADKSTTLAMYNMVRLGLGIRESFTPKQIGIGYVAVDMETLDYGKIINILGNKYVYESMRTGNIRIQDRSNLLEWENCNSLIH